MRHPSFEAVIGLEVHCQLLTASKLFSPESSAFGARPNRHVDPISLGHPGTLPVMNERMVEYTLRVGLATHCRIRPRSEFARKHYFYPDLPKGYQISQYDTPICHDGYIEISPEDENEGPPVVRRIGITRIHMEEDAGKSIHDQDPYHTLLDYNRCGVPLIEIVSEPDLRSPREAYLYLQKIRQIVRYLGICDGNMEEGSLRCDANVSIRPMGADALGTKTEVKNMNSFRNVERALTYEIERQIALVEAGGAVVQETLLWDAGLLETRTMRSKEEAHDYRYFPDPDLVQVVVTEQMLQQVRAVLPELPEERRARFEGELGLPPYDAALLTEERPVAHYFETVLEALEGHNVQDLQVRAKAVSNMVMTHVLRVLNERSMTVETFPISPERLAALIGLRLDDEISSTGAQALFDLMLEDERPPVVIAQAHQLMQVSDTGALSPLVEQVLADNPGQVKAYLGGKEGLIGFFIGQVMRSFPGSPDPKLVRTLLHDALEARRT